MKNRRSSTHGFTLVEVMVVVAIIGLLMAVGIPNLARARLNSQRNLCISHLREIDSIKQQWALENHRGVDSDAPTEAELKLYFWHERWPQCPAGGAYSPGRVGEPPTCSLGESLGHKLED